MKTRAEIRKKLNSHVPRFGLILGYCVLQLIEDLLNEPCCSTTESSAPEDFKEGIRVFKDQFEGYYGHFMEWHNG